MKKSGAKKFNKRVNWDARKLAPITRALYLIREVMMQLVRHGAALEKLIVKLASTHEQIYFAVAWASSGTAAFSAILKHRRKVKRAVIGTHFYQTHPDVLDQFIGDKSIRFVVQPQGVFHTSRSFRSL